MKAWSPHPVTSPTAGSDPKVQLSKRRRLNRRFAEDAHAGMAGIADDDLHARQHAPLGALEDAGENVALVEQQSGDAGPFVAGGRGRGRWRRDPAGVSPGAAELT